MAGMMTGLLLLLLAGVTVGRVVDLQKRILGGVQCAATERLHHVKLIQSEVTGDYVCGGTLIDKDWILTAAHCVPKVGTISVKAFLRVNPDGERNQFDININDIKRKKRIIGKFHDIAMLKLPKSATGFQTASFPECGTPPPQIVQIAGHTLTTIDINNTKVTTVIANLLCANINVVQCLDRECPSGYLYEHIFCYQETGVDAWEGDSGGGVMVNNVIYGVHVSSLKEACVEAQAMDVCKYLPWIAGVIKPKTCLDCLLDCFSCLKG